MTQFPKSFYKHLNDHTLVGIRVGPNREKFLDIWMVAVAKRIFARSWNRSTSGWYGRLIKGLPGEIRFGEQTLAIAGMQPALEPGFIAKIDQAYLKRFTQPENLSYAEAISRPEYHKFTVEIFPA